MPAIGFKAQFETAITSGKKRQTIRAPRKDDRQHCKPGDTVQLFVNMRQKNCREIARVVIQEVVQVDLRFGPARAMRLRGDEGQWESAHFKLDTFARSDGFADWDALEAFFMAEHGATDGFTGTLIRWESFGGSSDWAPPPVKATKAPTLKQRAVKKAMKRAGVKR